MAIDNLDLLAELIKRERNALLENWREQVRGLRSAKYLSIPALNDHVPNLIDELVVALKVKSDESIVDVVEVVSPTEHGMQRAQNDFDIEEVVAEYNVLRGCIHDLAQEHSLSLQGKPFHILNRVLDAAIGLAVRTYAMCRALEVQQRREEYLAFVAHDLRTPLSAIALANKILEQKLVGNSSDAEIHRLLDTSRRNTVHMKELIDKVIEENTNLQTEVGVKLQRRQFELWPLVEDLIHDLHPVAGTASTMLVNNVPAELVIFADASLLRRVFQNLIANAITYTPHGEVIIEAAEREGQIECVVRDDGAGISADRLDRIFDKLETDSERDDGAGLGLAIVKTFIQAHNGSITAESTPGLGAAFRFSLPVKQPNK